MAAHREILDRHKPTDGAEHEVCDVCSYVAWDDDTERIGGVYPCADVISIARIYRAEDRS